MFTTERFLILTGIWALAFSTVNATDKIQYNRDIRPILSDKCWACHGPDEHDRKADLRLDTREGALADLGGNVAIVPGHPEKSAFVYRITETDPDEIMPPPKSHKALDKSEIELLTLWIKEGAEYEAAWTYVPPKATKVPRPKDRQKWVRTDIDAYVLERLQDHGLTPSPEADSRTLLRRLSFDLTGLPPSPEVAEAYAANPSDKHYERLVDEFMADTAFGERMAIWWLDLVRYADTVGYHGDQTHNASPYRDYVIKAFNQNMPFDQFTREQLAGDLLPSPTLDQKVATCYNRLLQTSHEGGVQVKEYLAIYSADRVRNVSAVWMGATVGCAQCHDHKYDPYTAKDFYSMAAFFADIDEARHFKEGSNALPTKRPPEIDLLTDEELKEQKRLDALISNFKSDNDTANNQKKEAQNKVKELQKAKAAAEEIALAKKEISKADKHIKKAKDALNKARADRRAFDRTVLRCMVTESIQPRPIRILPRGNWMDESGEVVPPAIPAFMGTLDTEGRATRLDLANWLVSNDDSGLLTARVQMNRIWYLFFGTGISRSLEDFGGQGEPPAYPELLDHLAIAFVESGWDMKAMIKQMVMSSAYRQSSIVSPEDYEKDPDNQMVARQSRFRLPAEMIRDSALMISGLLNKNGGGLAAKPYQPEGYYRHLNFPPRTYKQHNDAQQYKRGVYVHWQRQFLHPMMKAFDAPSREECSAQRPISNTPTAALVLLNDPTFVEASRMLAARLITSSDDPHKRIELGGKLAWGRAPGEGEAKALHALLHEELAVYQKNPDAAKALATVGLTPWPNDINIQEAAGWTAVARALLCTNEAITRN